MTTGLIELDQGDAPTFTVYVTPADVTTLMTAVIVAPNLTSTPVVMSPNADKSVWTGVGPTLSTTGEHTATFTITGTGAGVQQYTVIVAVPAPLSSSLRMVRLLIPDTDPSNRLLRADEVQDLLDLEGGNVKLAAAQALDTIASSEALISKVIKTQDVSTDGAKLAQTLFKRATELRRQVSDNDGNTDDGGGFDVVDFIDPFTRSRLGVEEC